jgi:erythromycin esterase-like protein
MAENALAQLDRLGPASRGTLWAHNLHVWLEPARIGSHLRANLGPAYRCVCFLFGRGRYNAGAGKINPETRLAEPGFDWTLRPRVAELPPPGSIEHLLDRLDPDCFAVEPDTVGLLRHEAPFRCGGGVIFEGEGQFSCRCVPADVFDLLVYFRTVQPSRLL